MWYAKVIYRNEQAHSKLPALNNNVANTYIKHFTFILSFIDVSVAKRYDSYDSNELRKLKRSYLCS